MFKLAHCHHYSQLPRNIKLIPLPRPSHPTTPWQHLETTWHHLADNEYLQIILMSMIEFLLNIFIEIEDPANAFMRGNKCISPLALNGRSIADMKTLRVLGHCKKLREKYIEENNDKVCINNLFISHMLTLILAHSFHVITNI